MAIAPPIGLVTWLVAAAFSTPKEPSEFPLYGATLFAVSLVLSLVDRGRGWLVPFSLLVGELFGYSIASYAPAPPGGPDLALGGMFAFVLIGVGWTGILRLLKVVIDVLLGPPKEPQSGSCSHCGYDLTGNVSGVCPECGRKIDPAMLKPPPAE